MEVDGHCTPSDSRGLSAEVQDIKTGRPKPDPFYEPQLAAYRRAVHLLTGIPPERITSRIIRA